MTKIKQAVELLEEALEYGKDSCVVQALELLKSFEHADEDGWITWNGGECPVGIYTMVEVELSNGERIIGRAKEFIWELNTKGGWFSIISYRLIRD